MVGINVRVRCPNILCAGELARPSEGVFFHSNKARYVTDLAALDFFSRFLAVLTEFSTLPLLCG